MNCQRGHDQTTRGHANETRQSPSMGGNKWHPHWSMSTIARQFCGEPLRTAQVRSQSGPLASVLVLLRRLRMPLPLSVRRCSCGRILDPFGHHRAACSTVGVLRRRGFAVENAVPQICREGGARVSTNIFVRDLDLDVALHGWQKARSCGGRVVSFRVYPAGPGRHVGVSFAGERDSPQERRQSRRHRFA